MNMYYVCSLPYYALMIQNNVLYDNEYLKIPDLILYY